MSSPRLPEACEDSSEAIKDTWGGVERDGSDGKL